MLLKVDNLVTCYGSSQVLSQISFTIDEGEVVTLLGRNGMGKTTTIHSVTGIVAPSSGDIQFAGQRVYGLPSFQIARMGMGLVPEGRQIFPNLTVRENLVATAGNRLQHANPWSLEHILDMFPSLSSRLDFMGTLLSGGEQQMLAIGRALMTNPQLLILDDATEGLAPLVRDEIWRCLREIKASGLSILIVDKNITDLLGFADRHYVLEKGRVVWSGTSNDLAAQEELQHRYLGV